jgi:hypothetical protein
VFVDVIRPALCVERAVIAETTNQTRKSFAAKVAGAPSWCAACSRNWRDDAMNPACEKHHRGFSMFRRRPAAASATAAIVASPSNITLQPHKRHRAWPALSFRKAFSTSRCTVPSLGRERRVPWCQALSLLGPESMPGAWVFLVDSCQIFAFGRRRLFFALPSFLALCRRRSRKCPPR